MNVGLAMRIVQICFIEGTWLATRMVILSDLKGNNSVHLNRALLIFDAEKN